MLSSRSVEKFMVEKNSYEDTNIVDFSYGLERALASSLPAARLEDATIASDFSQRHRRPNDVKHAEKGASSKLFDFSFHAPTPQERQIVQVALFSVALAAVIITLGFAVAKAILGFF